MQRSISNRITQLYDEIQFILPINVLDKFYLFENKKYTRQFKFHKNKCIKKFHNLLESRRNSYNNDFNGIVSSDNIVSNTDNDKWLKNLSDVQIPGKVKKVLALGPKHALCVQKNYITSPKNFIFN